MYGVTRCHGWGVWGNQRYDSTYVRCMYVYTPYTHELLPFRYLYILIYMQIFICIEICYIYNVTRGCGRGVEGNQKYVCTFAEWCIRIRMHPCYLDSSIVYIYEYMYLYMYTYTYAHIYICVYIYTYICIYTYMYPYAPVLPRFQYIFIYD
jgi:hypothetical protein